MSISTTQAALTVNDAEVKLFQSKQDLWNEKVTQASGLYKIIGVVSYFWNVRSVMTLDKTYSDLLTKVSNQMLASTSHLNLPTNAQVNLSANELAQENLLQKQSDEALNAFYEAFKGRCSKLGVNEDKPEYAVYTQAAKQALENGKPKNSFQDKDDLIRNAKVPTNMKPMLAKFDKIMYKDMVATFAKHNAKNIDMKSFAAKSEMMSKMFKSEASEIEASLRQAALDSKVGNHSEAFKNLEAAFRKRGEGSEFEAYKKDIRAKQKELDEKETRLKALDGDKYGDPKALTHISSLKLKELLNHFTVAHAKYQENLGNRINGIIANDKVAQECLALSEKAKLQSPNLIETANKYLEAQAEHTKLLKEQTDLRKDVADLKDLLNETNLNTAAEAAMINKAEFYQRMQFGITDDNKKFQFEVMDALLKRAGIRK